MDVRLSIGDFSRMTHLSIKALRHYHELGVLVPTHVDRFTGYRYYAPEQLVSAQVIHRLRDLGMPLDGVRTVLAAGDPASRGQVIVDHLRSMEAQLERTQATVESLRALLERPVAEVAVEYRRVPVTRAVSIAEVVTASEANDWWVAAFAELDHVLAESGAERAGCRSALYATELFNDEEGRIEVYVPVAGDVAVSGRVQLVDVPAAELAIAVHHGRYDDLDRTYAPLGTHVAGREMGVDGPIREHYLVTYADTPDERRHRTEVGWPVFLTRAAPDA